MNYRRTLVYVVSAALLSCLVANIAWAADDQSGPLKQITETFPKSVEIKNKGKLLEFCPDNTCHGFSASDKISVVTLKDFAYLYVYFFSDYYALSEWRAKDDVKNTAERVLSKPEYSGCRKGNSRESARCVLLDLSRNGKIKLLFIRYDEGQRNVVHENISEQLSERSSAPK
jgi:hypothetical protein